MIRKPIQANLSHLPAIKTFTDFWLSGRGLRQNAPGAVNDCFISPSQHKRYILKYKTYIIIEDNKIIAWAVIQSNGSLIHFLVAGDHRNKGIGSDLLYKINPFKIRSKLDQSSGDPAPFYKKCGYRKTATIKSKSRVNIDSIRPDRKPNIDIFERA